MSRPPAGRGCAAIVASWACAMARTMARPNPQPRVPGPLDAELLERLELPIVFHGVMFELAATLFNVTWWYACRDLSG